MLRTLLAVLSMGAAVAIFSCSGAQLGGNVHDAGTDACTGTMIPAWCFDNTNGCWAIPSADGGACPANSSYHPEQCFQGAVDGRGPICSTGGTGGAGGGAAGAGK